MDGKQKKAANNATSAEVESKKSKFREFLKLMGSGAGTAREKQSWNDQFEAFMHRPGQQPQAAAPKKAEAEEKEENPEEKEDNDNSGEEVKQDETVAKEEDSLVDDKRLFVMNLSYQVTKEELEELFGKYGDIVDIEIPFRKYGKGVPLGLGFVRFVTTESAIQAFAELDKSYFQGRKIHIKPAERKPPAPVEEPRLPYPVDEQGQVIEYPPDHPEYKYQQEQKAKEEAKKNGETGAASTNYKKEKEQILKTNFDDETNWNYLFMNQDTVATSMAKQLNQTKGEFFDKEAGGSMAVKMAKSETIIINQTKEWLKEQSIIDFDVLDRIPRADCKRNHYILMVKNLPYTAKEAELKELFERYGEIKRFMLSPFNTLAIAEFTSKSMAKTALKNLAYHKVNFVNPIYLEYAPKGFVKKQGAAAAEDQEEVTVQEGQTKDDVQDRQQRQIFVKNLNFDTREEQLKATFEGAFTGGRVKAVTIIRRTDTGQSRGYGFIEMSTTAAAEKAVKLLQNFSLDDHALKLSLSTKAITETEEQKKKDKVLKKRKAGEALPNDEADLENEDV